MSKDKNGPKAEKPKHIDVIEVRRTRRFITVKYKQGDDTHTLKTNENPLPEFHQAMDALAPLACKVVEAPEGWNTNLKVTGLKHGTFRDVRSASIMLQRGVVLSGKVLNVSTPPALLSTPATEGVITEPLKPVDAELVANVIEEAKRYVKGERAQGTLDMEEPEATEGDPANEEGNQGQLIPLPPGDKGKPVKGKGKQTSQ